MQLSLATDVSFQKFMTKLVGEAVNEIASNRPDTDRDLAKRMLEARCRFVEVWLFPYSDPSQAGFAVVAEPIEDRARRLLAAMNVDRNSAEGQRFLKENPGVFERLDRRIYRAVREGALTRWG